MNLVESQQTTVVLANAGELVCAIAQGVIGNEVADTFGGSPITRGILYNLAQTKFQQALAKHIQPKE